jgi:hypothetical protein
LDKFDFEPWVLYETGIYILAKTSTKMREITNMIPKNTPFLALYCGLSMGHMTMDVPSNGGADNAPATQLCKGKRGKYDKPLQAGSSLAVKLGGSANHEGGGCQFGLSYDDGKSFTLLMTTDDSCPIKLDWNVPIPAEAPSCDKCVFAWGWIPRASGGPEYYMNCALVQVKGGASGGELSGPKMEFFNMEGYKKIHNDEGGARTGGLTKMFGESTYGGASGGKGSDTNIIPKNEETKGRKRRSTDSVKESTDKDSSQTESKISFGVDPKQKVVNPKEVDSFSVNQANNNITPEQVANNAGGKGESASDSSLIQTPSNLNTNSNSNMDSSNVGDLGSVYGDIKGVSAEELIQRAKSYQERVAAQQKLREAQQLDQQKKALQSNIAGASGR